MQYNTVQYPMQSMMMSMIMLFCEMFCKNIFRLRWNYGRCATYFVVSAIWKSNFLRYGKRFQFLLLKNCPLLLNWPFAMLKNHWKVHKKEKKKYCNKLRRPSVSWNLDKYLHGRYSFMFPMCLAPSLFWFK